MVIVGVYGIHKGVYDLSFALIGGDIHILEMVQCILELLLCEDRCFYLLFGNGFRDCIPFLAKLIQAS